VIVLAEVLDVKTALRTVLVQKQEAVRDFQSFASRINDTDVSKMFRHFAEAEALHATQIKDKLDELK
jgi:rubrerythrin